MSSPDGTTKSWHQVRTPDAQYMIDRKLVFVLLCFFCNPALIFVENGISNPLAQSIQNDQNTESSIVITPPRNRTLDPNTFPMFVFSINNNSNERHELAFSTLLPADWGIISFNSPSFIEPQSKAKVRITVMVPKDAMADITYKIELVTKWQTKSDTSFVEININPRSAFRLITFIEEKQVIPGENETLNYIIQNEGNISQKISLHAELPKEWDLIELVDSIEIAPSEKIAVDLLFKVPKGTPPRTKKPITLTATSLTAKKDSIDLVEKRTLQIIVAQMPDMDVSKSLNPVLPINFGFSINGIEKDKYPEMIIFANTESDNWGIPNFRTKMELALRSSPVPKGDKPQITTNRVRLELANQNTSVALGDVMVESSSLMTRTNQLTRNQSLGGTVRGGSVRYQNNRSDISILHGKGTYSDNTLSSLAANYMAAENLEISTSYLQKHESQDNSHVVNIDGLFDSNEGRSVGASLGLSKSKNSEKQLDGYGQLFGSTKFKDLELSERFYWADNSYSSVDRGRYGAALDTRWKPKQSFYFWGNLHTYNQNYFSSTADSSAFVADIKTRFILNFIDWPILNLGLSYNQKKYSTEFVEESKGLDFQIQKYFKYGRPSFYLSYDDKYDQAIESETRNINLRMNWDSSFRFARVKLEQKFDRQDVIRYDPSPWNSVSKVDMDFQFHGALFGMYYSNGRIWTGKSNNDNSRFEYQDKNISDIGLRSNFGIKIFGFDFKIRLEGGRNLYKSDSWTFFFSLSAGGASTFLFPVPLIETKGRIYGEIFIDRNGNGIKDIDEPGVSQVLIFFNHENALTDGDGKFEFPAMEPGEYPFSIDMASLSANLSIAKEIPETISLRPGSTIGLLIPVTSNCNIKGYVFLDSNVNGKHDSGEKGLGPVRIVIRDEKGNEWETYTAKDGYYELTDLLPGIYTVMIDSRWLPERTLLGKTDYTVVLSSETPTKITDLAVVNKRLQIKKTFTAPKK